MEQPAPTFNSRNPGAAATATEVVSPAFGTGLVLVALIGSKPGALQ